MSWGTEEAGKGRRWSRSAQSSKAGDLSWAWRDKLSTATLAEEKAFHVEGKGISTEARVRQGVVDEGGRGVGILAFGSQLGTV